jgi:Transglycosylase SLT domain
MDLLCASVLLASASGHRQRFLFCMQLKFKFVMFAALLALSGLCASAREVAVLRNGYTIPHERREVLGEMTRLYLGQTQENFVDVPSTDITSFEKEEVVLPRVLVAPPSKAVDTLVSDACDRNNLDPDLVNSVIAAESGFNPKAVSRKGAQGLMQLMPNTAAALGIRDAMNPAANVEGGTRYLRELLERFQYDLAKALAAYNAGPERVQQYGGLPPYPETVAYVRRILRDLRGKKSAQLSSQPASESKLGETEKPTAKSEPGPVASKTADLL